MSINLNDVAVTKVEAAFKPSGGYPHPVLFQESGRALLYFGGVRKPGDDDERVVAVFEGCTATRFGYPNDEALAGHPLYKRGLNLYGIFEVLPSPWMEEIQQQNLVNFPAFKMAVKRHIIITLHDDLFECLAKTFSIHLATDFPPEQLMTRFIP